MGRKKIEFTKEQDERITQLVSEGYSLNQILPVINGEFNSSFSRSGIDRRIKTLGIDNSSFNLEDFMEAKNNPMKLFNLTKSSLFVFLDDLRKIGWISIIKTAGLNTIHIEKNIEIQEVIRSIYLKK